MGLISLIWGMFSLVWMVLFLIPLLGMGNWLLIPFAAVGALIGAIGVLFSAAGRNGRAKAGLLLNLIVILVAIGRLMLGGGLL